MIGTIIIQVLGYSAAIFFGALAVISFISTEGKLKPENVNAFIRTFVLFFAISIAFAWATRFLAGYAP
ncbi:hypothetical protein [Methylorubrum suomiense]|uniref:Uncharacterized protein n=1 Tax=Methylorubrum suomiense TaxID=144191 RepID=A0ABQ4V0N7_9HYPH|nr:hypothetical protein [Methylorubrum suomiense]GJE77199.1 hypothetical protein BGCPKDLD_3802 [Methylorubrum suomiense]